MKKRPPLIPILLAFGALLAAGVLAGVAVADTGGSDGTPTTTAATTAPADPTTAATTTTTPVTTTAPPTTTDVTTTTPAATGQTTTQAAAPQSAPQTTPTAACGAGTVSCGNNAATQIAVVYQNCNAATSNSSIDVQVTTLSGAPVNNFTIGNVTTCMNELSITQVVQQFCLGCTVIVMPPPRVQTVTTTVTNDVYETPKPRAFYCTDGDVRSMVQLDLGQPDWDPQFKGAVLAVIDAAGELSCPGSTDVAPTTPTFTLTVPASLIGQWVNLCIQQANPKAKPQCHSIRLDGATTVSIPMTSNVAATVTKSPVPSAKAILAASRSFNAKAKTKAKKKTKVKHTTKKRRVKG